MNAIFVILFYQFLYKHVIIYGFIFIYFLKTSLNIDYGGRYEFDKIRTINAFIHLIFKLGMISILLNYLCIFYLTI